jgi:hypothetical protein
VHPSCCCCCCCCCCCRRFPCSQLSSAPPGLSEGCRAAQCSALHITLHPGPGPAAVAAAGGCS